MTLLSLLEWRSDKIDGEFYLKYTVARVGKNTDLYLELLQLAIALGCSDAYRELDARMRDRFDAATFTRATRSQLTYFATPGLLQHILQAIGQKELDESNSDEAWEWLVENRKTLSLMTDGTEWYILKSTRYDSPTREGEGRTIKN